MFKVLSVVNPLHDINVFLKKAYVSDRDSKLAAKDWGKGNNEDLNLKIHKLQQDTWDNINQAKKLLAKLAKQNPEFKGARIM